MNKILISIFLIFFPLTASIAAANFNDAFRIQQVLPSDNGSEVILKQRKFYQDNYQYQLSILNNKLNIISQDLIIQNDSPLLAVWGPTTHQLTYIKKNNEYSNIIIFDKQTQKEELLFSIHANVLSLQYSPNYSKLALVIKEESKEEVYSLEESIKPKNQLIIYDLATKKKWNATPDNKSVNRDISWFKDESRILLQVQPSLAYFDSWYGTIGILDINNKTFSSISHNQSLNENPILSTNEKYIAYLTNDLPENKRPKVFQFKQIILYDVLTKKDVFLPETFDGAPQLIAFSNDDNDILYGEAKHGAQIINKIGVFQPHRQTMVTSDQDLIRNITLNHQKTIIGFIKENPLEATTPCVMTLQDLNIFCLPKVKINDIQFEVLHYPSFDGKEIQAFLVRPKNVKKALPTIIIAHGGPTYHSFREYLDSPYSYDLPFIPADYARKGIAVFIPNYRGSIGYGPQFRKANNDDPGNADFKDLLAGIDYLVKHEIAEKERLGIFGWSYGGFLCEYAATQTNLFKAAVCGAGISDWISHDSTSEFKAYTSGYFGKNYSRDFNKNNLLLLRSPALQIKYHQTPVLLLHGDNDHAVNYNQAIEFYWAYKKAGGTVQLALFHHEDHEFVKPQSIQQAIKMVKQWFERYLIL